jgi:hypothetical protein
MKKGFCAATAVKLLNRFPREEGSRVTATPSLPGAISGGSLPGRRPGRQRERSRARSDPRAPARGLVHPLQLVQHGRERPRSLEFRSDAGPGYKSAHRGGKTGVLYVLDPAMPPGLGKIAPNDSGAVQKIQVSVSELLGGSVYWRRSVADGGPLLYNWGMNDAVKAFPFNGTTFATTPSAQGGATHQIRPGGILTLSANGGASGTGVLWATVAASGDVASPPVPGLLYAFDAGNVATELWSSNMDATLDSLGNFAKFVPPLVANGKVYVAIWSGQVAVYGLTAVTLTAVSPSSGSTAGGISVTLTGTNFVSGATVSFGGSAATSVVVVNARKITAHAAA